MIFSSSSQVIIVAPILPTISEALDIARSVQGTLVSAYAITLSVCALITGPISDRFGRRRILLFGTSSMTIALALHGLAENYAAFLGVRALAGVSGGMLSGGAVAYVGDYFPYDKRGWANGWVMSGIAFGQVGGVPIGIYLAEQYGFRVPFLLFGATMGLTFLIILRYLPAPEVDLDSRRLSLRRFAQKYRTLLRQPSVTSATIIYALMFLSIALYVVYLPTWLKEVHALTGTEIAYLFLAGGAASVFAGPLAGVISDRVGRKPVIIGACIGLAILITGTPYAMEQPFVTYGLFFLVMMLISVRISPLQALLTALVPDSRRGMLMSMAVAIGQLGIAVGGGIAGPAYTQFGYESNAFLAAAATVLMIGLIWRTLPEPSLEQPSSRQSSVHSAPSLSEDLNSSSTGTI
jgi:predicted MFS family arabinose efflux permease